ncbi:MAG: hypothetical protein H0U17_01925 [Actinobacteria bacterium]|nr:hypothetical protein [Actinomycetota bacterium]
MSQRTGPRATGGRSRAGGANDTAKPTMPVTAVKDRVRADSGAVLEWIDAHREKHGWSHGRWRVAEQAQDVSPRVRPAQVELDHDVAQQLVSSSEFSLAWTLAKDLAKLPPRLARADVVASWPAISERVDPEFVLETAGMIRAAAIERFIGAETVSRAVCRLLDDVDREVSS